jgi:hypothetical protein
MGWFRITAHMNHDSKTLKFPYRWSRGSSLSVETRQIYPIRVAELHLRERKANEGADTLTSEAVRVLPKPLEADEGASRVQSSVELQQDESPKLGPESGAHIKDAAADLAPSKPVAREPFWSMDNGDLTPQKDASIEDLENLLDLNHDPLVEPGQGPSQKSLDQVERICPRTFVAPSLQAQSKEINRLLNAIENEPSKPGPDLVQETESAIDNLKGAIPGADKFVAGSLQAYLPAWKALLAKSKRASSRQILRWLEHGFVPKFVGTADAPHKNKEAVRRMLERVMTTQQAETFLQTKTPGRVEFRNHRSFYNHWDFASGEVVNLFKVTAATLLPIGAEKPVLVHPFGVATTAGKKRLICDARAEHLLEESVF